MTRTTRLDDVLIGWFEADAAAPAPTDLAGRVLERTRGRHPRARWHAVVHELPWGMEGALALPWTRRAVWVSTLLLLTLLLTGAVLIGANLVHEERRVVTTIAADRLLERDGHQAVRLEDGRVLVVGGSNGSGPMADAAVVDPWTGEIEAVPMLERRDWGMTATALQDGRVLVAGGHAPDGDGGVEDTASAEVFDPTTDTFDAVGDMTSARGAATVLKVFVPVTVPLADGRVLLVGGTTEQVAGRTFPRAGDIFDPRTGSFSATPALPCRGVPDEGRSGQEVRTADLMPDGRILLGCEGWGGDAGRGRPGPARGSGAIAPDTQAFFSMDLATGVAEPVTVAADPLVRTMALGDGTVLAWSAAGFDELSNTGERVSVHALARLDLADLSLRWLDAMVTSGTAATRLDSGHIVLAGGYQPGSSTPVRGASLARDIRVLDPCSGDVTMVGELETTRVGGTATQLGDDHLLLVGGQVGRDPNMHEPAEPEIVELSGLPAAACTG
jgi:hypothetical protein